MIIERNFVEDQSGVSFIELLIVIVLLSLAFGALMKVFTTSTDITAEAEIRTIQATLANDSMNKIRSKRFDEHFTEEWSTTLGPEEILSSDYDDVDDFDGFSEPAVSGFPHYSRSASVTYVDVGQGLKTLVTGPTDYKLVTVAVGHKTLSSIVDSLVITPGIPSHHYNHPLCLAGGIEFESIITGKKQVFYGPFPERQMTFTVDGGAGTFRVDCTVCLNVGDTNGVLKIASIFDPSGEMAAVCGSP